MRLDNFRAKQGGGVTLSATTSSQALTVTGGQAILVSNKSTTDDLFFHWNADNSTPTAAATDGNWSICVVAGTTQCFDIPPGISRLAYIASAGLTARMMTGEGS